MAMSLVKVVAGLRVVVAVGAVVAGVAAQGAGPIATVIQDVLSLAVYLGFVRVLMG